MAAIDQRAADKKVQARRAANKKRAAERKAARKAKIAKKRETSKAKEKSRLEKMPVYKSKKDYSKAGSPKKTPKFGEAFSSARKAGKKTFDWKGKSYHTKTADDVKKAASKPDVRKIVKNIAKSKKTEKVTPQKYC